MKILNSEQVRKLDEYTIKNEPILSINLMERASRICTNQILKLIDPNSPVSVFIGPGNNGGDGLALARMIADNGYAVKVFICGNKLSTDSLINYEKLLIQKLVYIKFLVEGDELPRIKSNEYIVDALFGSGLSKPVTGFFSEIIQHINKSSARVLSIDIPSGFFSETNSQLTKSLDGGYINAIRADETLTLQLPFLSFMLPDAQNHIGNLHILPIGLNQTYLTEIESDYFYIDKEMAKSILRKRKKFDHKGNYGHALIIAGSYGKMGAAILTSKACLRAGVGLLTVHVPVSGYEIMQVAVPEAMVCIDESETHFCKTEEQGHYSAIGIGPGIGTLKATSDLLENLLKNSKKPVVLDADAINIIAERPDLLKNIPANSILTPHPGEFRRLAGDWDNYFNRLLMQMEFSKKYKIYIVLKGAHTSVSTPDGKCYFNSTGNPGMATAGSGDALTGIITSFVAQAYTPLNAALLGVFIHGLAGDFAAEKCGQEALIAGDIIDHIGAAFKAI